MSPKLAGINRGMCGNLVCMALQESGAGQVREEHLGGAKSLVLVEILLSVPSKLGQADRIFNIGWEVHNRVC